MLLLVLFEMTAASWDIVVKYLSRMYEALDAFLNAIKWFFFK